MKGLITIESEYSVEETMDWVESLAKTKGLTIFARIDHAYNASKKQLQLRPTELIIFGNPEAGTVLMQDNQIAGIDFPVKILAWEDEKGKVWLTYNDTAWIAERHNLSAKSKSVLKTIEEGMAFIIKASTKK
jgi:uncharacterized protein (DUF302 family)